MKTGLKYRKKANTMKLFVRAKVAQTSVLAKRIGVGAFRNGIRAATLAPWRPILAEHISCRFVRDGK